VFTIAVLLDHNYLFTLLEGPCCGIHREMCKISKSFEALKESNKYVFFAGKIAMPQAISREITF